MNVFVILMVNKLIKEAVSHGQQFNKYKTQGTGVYFQLVSKWTTQSPSYATRPIPIPKWSGSHQLGSKITLSKIIDTLHQNYAQAKMEENWLILFDFSPLLFSSSLEFTLTQQFIPTAYLVLQFIWDYQSAKSTIKYTNQNEAKRRPPASFDCINRTRK